MFLKNKLYLAGGMEYAKDYGVQWRKDLTPALVNKGYEVLDPTLHEKEVGITPYEMMELKSKDYKKYTEYAQAIVDYDTNLVSSCNLIVAMIDESALKGAGTIGEITLARYKKIPIHAIVNLPNQNYDLPLWIMGCLSSYSLTYEDLLKNIPNLKEELSQAVANYYDAVWFTDY